MTGGMAKQWIIPRVGDKELSRVGHQLASCNLLISYVLMFFRERESLSNLLICMPCMLGSNSFRPVSIFTFIQVLSLDVPCSSHFSVQLIPSVNMFTACMFLYFDVLLLLCRPPTETDRGGPAKPGSYHTYLHSDSGNA